MKRIKRKDEEGAMGVGTLIVFIAMVLVAAVAASVLISTANKLQQQAQKTGDQAIQEVSTALSVKDIVVMNPSGGPDEYDTITIRYKLSAGAPKQNLANTLIRISNGNQSFSIKADEIDGDPANPTTYDVYNEEGVSQYPSTILSQGYMAENTIDITSPASGVDGIEPLGTQESMTIRIIPKHGTPTLEKFSTPPVMTDDIIEVS